MKLVLLVLFAFQASFCEVHKGLEVGHQNKFRCESRLGKGSFGEVWLGESTSVQPPTKVALKFESIFVRAPTVPNEIMVYAALKNIYGIPKVHYSGRVDNKNVLVMDLVGDSFEKIQENSKDKKFSHKSIALFAIQALERLQDIHSKGVVHRDLKPENFAMDSTGRVVMLLDFGLASFYIDRITKEHIQQGNVSGICGSPRYMSRSAHVLKYQGRSNDLESLGYVLKVFVDNKLPWSGLPKENNFYELYKSKVNLNLEQFCEGLPSMYFEYLKYVRGLGFDTPPDYDYLKGLFRSYLSAEKLPEDYIFDWTTEEQAKLPIPVKPQLQIQPQAWDIRMKIDNLTALPPQGTNVTADATKPTLPIASMGQASPQFPGWANRPVTGSATKRSLRERMSKKFRSALCSAIKFFVRKSENRCASI